MSINEFHAPNLSFIGHRDHVSFDYYYKLRLELVFLLSYLRCFSVGEKRTARALAAPLEEKNAVS